MFLCVWDFFLIKLKIFVLLFFIIFEEKRLELELLWMLYDYKFLIFILIYIVRDC